MVAGSSRSSLVYIGLATTALAAALLYGFVQIVAPYLVSVVPPDISTQMNIDRLFLEIDRYAQEHKSLPPSLDVLPTTPDYPTRKRDAWNHPLHYTVSNGIITITSQGPRPGAEISESYYTTNEDGTLWVGTDPDWIIQANVGNCPRPSLPRYGLLNPANEDVDFSKTSSHGFHWDREPNEYRASYCR